jgi:hypothetical protein
MSTSTGGALNLVKPALTDDHKVTIGTDLPANFQKIDDEFSTHLADYTLQVPYVEATGTTNTYSATLNPAPSSLVSGLALAVKIPIGSTGASTININNLGAKGIKKANGSDVTNLKAGGIYTLRYDGSNFILQGEGASGNATASDLLSGKTATTDAGEIIGTIPSKAAQTYTPGTTNQVIPAGQYLAGNQTIEGSANLVPENIKEGVNIFGVLGTSILAPLVTSGQYTILNSDYPQSFNIGFEPNSLLLWFYYSGSFQSIAIVWNSFNYVSPGISGVFKGGIIDGGTVVLSGTNVILPITKQQSGGVVYWLAIK